MSLNSKKAKEMLERMERMEKDFSYPSAPISTSSVGYLNPVFGPYYPTRKKKGKKKKEKYLR